MKRLFALFLKEKGLTISGVPGKAALNDLSINFNKWANSDKRSNRQGTGRLALKGYIAKAVSRRRAIRPSN